MMQLRLAGLRADPDRLGNAIDVVANLEADLRLEVDGEEIYAEASFPVAELAAGLARWSTTPSDDRPDFEFDSISAEEPGLIWIRRVDDGWRVGSIRQEKPDLRAFSGPEIDQLVQDYIGELRDRVEETYGRAVAANLREALRSAP